MSSKNKIAQRKKFEKWCRRCNLYTATQTQANPKHPSQAQKRYQIVTDFPLLVVTFAI